MIGLGIMGSAMSANLRAAGFQTVGYDVLPARRSEQRRAGGAVARSAGEIGGRADVVITSLPSSEALLATAAGVRAATRRPAIVVETSTLPIAVKQQARAILKGGGTVLLDCPLSGTGAQARRKDLVVYVSGDRAACRRVAPLLEGFSRAHHYVGPFGAGSKMKFIANLLVAIHNVAAAEAIVLGIKAGLDPALVLRVIADGAGSSRMLQVRGPMMVAGDYRDATMKLDVWRKDMAIIGDFVREVGAAAPLFAATGPVYTAARAMGRGGEDTAAVCAVLEALSGKERRPRPR
jgi:L-threonate 2-dehydrogenase